MLNIKLDSPFQEPILMSLTCNSNCRRSSIRKSNNKKLTRKNLLRSNKKRRQLSRNWPRSKSRRRKSTRLMFLRWIKSGTCSAEISICLTTRMPWVSGLKSTKKVSTQLLSSKSTPSRSSRKKASNFQRSPRTIMLQINSDNLRPFKLISIEISTMKNSLSNSSLLPKKRLRISDTSTKMVLLIQPLNRLLEASLKFLLMRNDNKAMKCQSRKPDSI